MRRGRLPRPLKDVHTRTMPTWTKGRYLSGISGHSLNTSFDGRSSKKNVVRIIDRPSALEWSTITHVLRDIMSHGLPYSSSLTLPLLLN